jgi:hypothetical protein
MKQYFLMIVFIVSFVSTAWAQSGDVIIKADPRVDSLLMLNIEHNKKYPFIQGYRIQIFKESGNAALDEANAMIEEFYENFPEIPAYLSFQEPYYRVRAGNFRTRLEALDNLEKIKRKYRNVWIITDNIYFSDTINHANTLNTDNYE